jgi:hypothetical protein
LVGKVSKKLCGFESYFTYRYMFSRKHLKLKISAFSQSMSTAFPHTKSYYSTNSSTPVEIDPFQRLVDAIKNAIERNEEIVRIPFSKKLTKILDILEKRRFITCDPRSNPDEDFIIHVGIRITGPRVVFIRGMRVMEMPIFYSLMGKEVKATLSNSNVKVAEYFETYVIVYTLERVHVLSTKSTARCGVYERDVTTAADLW